MFDQDASHFLKWENWSLFFNHIGWF